MDMDTLIEFDNHPDTLNSYVGSFHVWWDIRYHIFDHIKAFSTGVEDPPYKLRFSFIKTVKYIFYAIFCFPSFVKNRDIVFFTSNVVNMRSETGYENRLYDVFFNMYKDNSILLENSFEFCFRRPRIQKVYYPDLLRVGTRFFSRFAYIKKTEQVLLDEQLDKIKLLFRDIIDDTFFVFLRKRLHRDYKCFCTGVFLYSWLLKRLQPKIVFNEDSSYGGWYNLVISFVCQKLNIIFAEFQHGLVSKNHPAYNYGSEFISSIIGKNLLPRYFLVFGKYWADQIRVPSEKVVIGFPYLDKYAAKKLLMPSTEKVILLVSDGNLPKLFANIALTLASSLQEKGYMIILKLHPIEVPLMQERYGFLGQFSNVVIKTYQPVYELLLQSSFVIGCASTVMFEAIRFGLKPFVYVNMRSAEHMDLTLFNTFSSVEDIPMLLTNNANVKKNKSHQHIWADNAMKNFENFISLVI